MKNKEIEELKKRLEIQADSISAHITLQHKLQMRISELEKENNELIKLGNRFEQIIKEGGKG